MNSNEKLFSACSKGDTEVVNRLLHRWLFKPDVNKKDNIIGNTALHKAAEIGNYEIISLLLNHGADINVVNIHGNTPLLDAIERNQFNAALQLIHNGADINVSYYHDENPLLLMCRSLFRLDFDGRHTVDKYDTDWINNNAKQAEELISLLIQKGINVNKTDRKGRTALHHAAENSLNKIAGILIKNGADVNVKDINGLTPYELARQKGHKRFCKMLLDYHANTNN